MRSRASSTPDLAAKYVRFDCRNPEFTPVSPLLENINAKPIAVTRIKANSATRSAMPCSDFLA
jgi:hypothetical protein